MKLEWPPIYEVYRKDSLGSLGELISEHRTLEEANERVRELGDEYRIASKVRRLSGPATLADLMALEERLLKALAKPGEG